MIVAGSASPLLLSSAGGYNLTNSLRFRASASAYLNRTQTTPTTATKWTYSYWVKRGTIGGSSVQTMISGTGGGGSGIIFYNDKLWASSYSGGYQWNFLSAAVYRDTSAWYHIMVAYDSTQATDTNRVKIYVNGVQLTAFTTDVGATTYPSLNSVGQVGGVSGSVRIGLRDDGFYYLDGYLAEMYFVDGQQLTPSSFGETSATTGVWIPKEYTGTYGTNGFYLPFTDNSALTTSSNVGLGKDFSGNANYWTTNNISITSGSTYDSMTDVPTLTSATTANYAVLNPLINPIGFNYSTLSNGNLTTVGNSSSNNGVNFSTQTIKSGKWYAEFTCTGSSGSYPIVGITDITQVATFGGTPGYPSNGVGYLASGLKAINNVQTAYGSSFTTNNVIGVAIDADNGAVYFSIDGTFQNSGVPTSGASKTGAAYTYTGGTIEFYISASPYQSGTGFNANFGQRPFSYTPPTGFVRLNTFNLPTPTIGATASTTANKYFDINTYTGDGSQTASFTNSGSMQPDMVWSRIRSGTPQAIGVFDSVRGTTGQSLDTAATTAEGTWNGALSSEYGYVSAFNSNGFSVNDGSVATTGGYVNFSGRTYVGWQWRASNATAVTNTDGTITSTVSANTSAGFSIVRISASGSSGSIGHGLGVAPSMIIGKNTAGADDWYTYHASIGTGAFIRLNTTGAQASSASAYTNINSTTFTAGSGVLSNNAHIFYCFAQVAGYSAFGSYTGNGDPNGAFVYLGFRPKFVLIKSTASGTNWVLHDSSREPFNEMGTNSIGYALNTENSAVESTNANLWAIDFTSNGFKNRSSSASVNSSGQTYIYMAFAENPFKYANAK